MLQYVPIEKVFLQPYFGYFLLFIYKLNLTKLCFIQAVVKSSSIYLSPGPDNRASVQ